MDKIGMVDGDKLLDWLESKVWSCRDTQEKHGWNDAVWTLNGLVRDGKFKPARGKDPFYCPGPIKRGSNTPAPTQPEKCPKCKSVLTLKGKGESLFYQCDTCGHCPVVTKTKTGIELTKFELQPPVSAPEKCPTCDCPWNGYKCPHCDTDSAQPESPAPTQPEKCPKCEGLNALRVFCEFKLDKAEKDCNRAEFADITDIIQQIEHIQGVRA